jgi:hypothetical protein
MSIGATTLEKIRTAIAVEGGTPIEVYPVDVRITSDSATVEAEVRAYDTLAVALNHLDVQGDSATAPERLAQTISQTVGYLWEPLAMIERDLETGRVEMRSAPPLIKGSDIEFYRGELMPQAEGVRLHLIRLRQTDDDRRRTQIPLVLTHATLRRLIDDLAAILGTTR